MPRILIVDTYYPDFLKSLPFDSSSSYEAELRKVLDRSFGTADFCSRNLKVLGWDAIDVIANHESLQKLWAKEHGNLSHPWAVLEAQVSDFEPSVIFMQDLSLDPPNYGPRLLAGQCSCPWPGDEQVRQYDVIFTSFPHYVERIRALGVKAVYNPLAFDPSVIDQAFDAWMPPNRTRASIINATNTCPRPHDVVFIGGVGNPSHWKYGMEVLETVAREIPGFRWWGYGFEHLPKGMALPNAYCGEAYGLDMYQILLQSKICLNRHGEVAEGYANNMRLFEATGTGALLLTEGARNLRDFFYGDEVATYSSPKDAVNQIRHFLDDEQDRKWVASKGQKRTLAQHTYKQRMQVVSETLKGML